MKFLRTSEIYSEFESMVNEIARGGRIKKFLSFNDLFILSPYLKFPEILYERLCNANERGATIIMIFGKSDLSLEEKQKFSKISKIKLFFYENLHAKLYMVYSKAILCSMNLYDYSIQNNREMGVLIEDLSIIGEIRIEVKDILKHSKRIYYDGMVEDNWELYY